MIKEDSDMYASVFERAYTARYRTEGQQKMAGNLLAEGVSRDVIAKASGCFMTAMIRDNLDDDGCGRRRLVSVL